MKLTHLFNEGSNWHTDPEQQSMDATRRARLGREREPAGSDAIDARLAANNNARQQYAETGHFWLKQKDTQQHLNDQPYVGKAAANAAALELLKQQPELRGNLVITAYGPGEQQVTEGRVKELGQDLKDKAMSDNEFKAKYSKTRAEVRAAMREKQGVAEVSQQTLQSYRKKAAKQKSDALDVTDRPDTDDATWVKNINIASKRKDGIAAANKRLGVAEGSEYKSRHAHKQEQDKAYNEYRKKHATSSLALMTRAEFAKDQRERKAKEKQGVAEGSYDYVKRGKELSAATKKTQADLDRRIKKLDQGVAEGISIIDQDSDLDQQVFTLNVDGNKVSFTYWDYETNFQHPDIKDIYQQAKEQLSKKLSPEQIKDVARTVFKSFEQGVAEGSEQMVGFHLDSERAYEAVMAKFGHVIDHDEDSGTMYVPERLWPTVEATAYDADGIGAQRDDELENPEHYGVDEAQYDSGDYYNARSGAEYGRDLNPTGNGGPGAGTKRDDIFKGQSNQLPADPFGRTSGAVPRTGTGRIHSTALPDEMDEGEKVGNMDADRFDAAMARLKQLAGAGPMRTVYDPEKRVYKNVPVAQQPGDKK